MKANRITMENVIKGDYVITPCKNAFDNKISFWISKKGYMIALYCFSLYESDIDEYEKHIAEFDAYVRCYEAKVS